MCFERYVPDKIKAVAMPSLVVLENQRECLKCQHSPHKWRCQSVALSSATQNRGVRSKPGLTEWDLNGQSLFASPNIQVPDSGSIREIQIRLRTQQSDDVPASEYRFTACLKALCRRKFAFHSAGKDIPTTMRKA